MLSTAGWAIAGLALRWGLAHRERADRAETQLMAARARVDALTAAMVRTADLRASSTSLRPPARRWELPS